jgi:hypothetical protein
MKKGKILRGKLETLKAHAEQLELLGYAVKYKKSGGFIADLPQRVKNFHKDPEGEYPELDSKSKK